MAECDLMPPGFGVLVQGLLFLVCCLGLVAKKLRDPHRTWPEFLLDSSKQLSGAGLVHVLNLLCAGAFADRLEGDACSWYWINIVVDCTVGVGVEYALLLGLMRLLRWLLGSGAEDFETGNYGDLGQIHKVRYFKQLLLWWVIVACMKLLMVLCMVLGRGGFLAAAEFALSPVRGSPRLELVAVMIVTPTCMNLLQFWITDNFIKRQPRPARYTKHDDLDDLDAHGVSLQPMDDLAELCVPDPDDPLGRRLSASARELGI